MNNASMTSILYGRPPAVFDPPAGAVQTSPLIPGSADLAEMTAGSLDAATILAPPGVLERRYVLALALKALKPGGRLDVMAPKQKGGVLWMVANRHLPYEAELAAGFRQSGEIVRDGGFKVLWAKR